VTVTDEPSVQAQRRDRELERRSNRKTTPPLAGLFSTKLVGVSYVPDYPNTLERIEERLARLPRAKWEEATSHYPNFGGEMAQMYAENDWERLMEEGPRETEWVELVRAPDNAHDPNAIAVHWNGEMIGHLNKVISFRLAPELDAGITWLARVESVAGDDDLIGCTIRCKRVED
jgi:hypothetical protein